MPVKRRRAKQRLGDAAEAKAWEMLFESGYDFFHDLEPFGFPGGDVDEAARRAARQAWARFGRHFLDSRSPSDTRTPWALETFGEPKCR